jgi:hypothetical protein
MIEQLFVYILGPNVTVFAVVALTILGIVWGIGHIVPRANRRDRLWKAQEVLAVNPPQIAGGSDWPDGEWRP